MSFIFYFGERYTVISLCYYTVRQRLDLEKVLLYEQENHFEYVFLIFAVA